LAEQSDNLFATWEWASTWWRHFGGDRPLRLIGCRRPDGSLAAILPLYEAGSRPLRVARFVGHGPADQLGPVAPAAERPAAVRALRRATEWSSPRWDLILAERLPVDESRSVRTGATIVRRESSPVVRIDGTTWEDFLGARSANFRQQVRRRERKLMREHAVGYRLSDDPARLPEDLDTLLALHRARWGPELGAFPATRRAFHRDFASLALERGWLRLWIAEVGDRPIAAWYGFRFGGADWYYQAGRDPAWEHSSVGFVLLAHTIREAFRDGMREYRLLLGDEPYKERFATGDPGLETIALAGTRRGGVALRGESLVHRLPGRASGLTGRLIDRGTRR
jgi:CelD/BcsL family acetyltransferase involved in cellulose biosynthesis